jgi:SSS family solute:Na+ symporter
VLNSSSTVFTMDLYKPLWAPEASGEHLVRVGRWSGVIIMAFATLLAVWFSRGQHMVFTLIQNVGAWIAAPISVIFLAGVLWKRATAAAATTVLIFGFPYTWIVENIFFRYVPLLEPFNNWLNRTFLVWITCLILMIGVSLMTPAPNVRQIEGMIWSPRYARLPESEAERNRGIRNLALWWGLFVGGIAVLYVYLIWFQIQHR